MRGCGHEQRSRTGDFLAVHYQEFEETGVLVNSTEGGSPLTFQLGKGEVPAGWDEGLLKLCAGEIVELVVSDNSGRNCSQ